MITIRRNLYKGLAMSYHHGCHVIVSPGTSSTFRLQLFDREDGKLEITLIDVGLMKDLGSVIVKPIASNQIVIESRRIGKEQ